MAKRISSGGGNLTVPTHHDEIVMAEESRPDVSEAEVRAILTSGDWFLRFPAALEKGYRTHHRQRAISTFHSRGLIAILLFVVVSSGIIKLLPDTSYLHWVMFSGGSFVVVMATWGLSFVPLFNRWFEWYVAIGGMITLAISIVANNTVTMGDGATLSYVGLIYIVFFIYSFIGLRFSAALIAGWVGGISGIIITYAIGSEMNWQMLHRIYTAASVLGMCLAYGLDHQDRVNYLQSYLLQQTLNRSEELVGQLGKLSREDALTGLANRRYLNEWMEHEWNRAQRQRQPLVIMMVDIDYFKRYNDQLGHVAGDQCLRQVAQLLKGLTHRSGELAARYGGEEFVLLFPGMDADFAKHQAQRLLERVANEAIPHPDGGGRCVSISIGISLCVPKPPMTVDQLLRQADTALYQAKTNGRNRYEFFRDALWESMSGSKITPTPSRNANKKPPENSGG